MGYSPDFASTLREAEEHKDHRTTDYLPHWPFLPDEDEQGLELIDFDRIDEPEPPLPSVPTSKENTSRGNEGDGPSLPDLSLLNNKNLSRAGLKPDRHIDSDATISVISSAPANEDDWVHVSSPSPGQPSGNQEERNRTRTFQTEGIPVNPFSSDPILPRMSNKRMGSPIESIYDAESKRQRLE